MTAVLRLSGIAKRFGATLALDGATLEVQPGEVHALLGENGAGKSTLLSILGGLQRPTPGRWRWAASAYAPRSPRDARARGIALIHQELSLFPHLSVAENVLMGTEPSRRGLWDRERGPQPDARRAGRVRASRHRSRRARGPPADRRRARWSRSAARSRRAPAWC